MRKKKGIGWQKSIEIQRQNAFYMDLNLLHWKESTVKEEKEINASLVVIDN